MAELKTKKNDSSVEAFINSVKDEKKRKDSFEILELFKKLTGEEPNMWGSSIVGFGNFKYKYANGTENDWMLTGFSPRKQNLTLYVMNGFDRYEDLLGRLGKHKTSKSCLYIKRLEDINLDVLSEIVLDSINRLQGK